MAVRLATVLLAVALLAPLVVPPSADARGCRDVARHRVEAQNVSCRYARRAVHRWLRSGRPPEAGWRCISRSRRTLSCARRQQAFGAYRR